MENSPAFPPSWCDYESRLELLCARRERERDQFREAAKASVPFGKPAKTSDASGGAEEDSKRSEENDSPACSWGRQRPEPQSWQESFAASEEAWLEFSNSASPICSVQDIPWPDDSLQGFKFVGVCESASRHEKRQAVKKLLLRFHPDKFFQKLSSRFRGDAAVLGQERALEVARRLTELTDAC